MQISEDRFQTESGWLDISIKINEKKLIMPKNNKSCYTVSPEQRIKISIRKRKFHPDSAWKRSSEICMKLTSAECTVENS
jgi:hypothetical protein